MEINTKSIKYVLCWSNINVITFVRVQELSTFTYYDSNNIKRMIKSQHIFLLHLCR